MKLWNIKHKNVFYFAQIENGKALCFDEELKAVKELPLAEITVLPLPLPSKLVCVGLNYKAHAKEINMPLPLEPAFFLKPQTTIINEQEEILLPKNIGSIHYEGELAFVIKKRCANIRTEDASDYILGYTIANDVTARDIQKTDTLMGRCKAYNTFTPIAPFIETVPPSAKSVLRTFVNGELKQESQLADMVFSPYEILANLSHVMTFNPLDIILTGTPHNVGPIVHNDIVRIEIENVGSLENKAIAKS